MEGTAAICVCVIPEDDARSPGGERAAPELGPDRQRGMLARHIRGVSMVSQSARVVKGADLRSTAGNCARCRGRLAVASPASASWLRQQPRISRTQAPPAGLEPAIFALEVRRLVLAAEGAVRRTPSQALMLHARGQAGRARYRAARVTPARQRPWRTARASVAWRALGNDRARQTGESAARRCHGWTIILREFSAVTLAV
jgi:hypothetical protein